MKILLALAAALAVTPAVAQSPAGGSVQVAISYADLDLRTAAGIRTLDRRIRTAVQEACGPTSSFDLEGGQWVRACRADALERLAAQRQIAIAAAQPRPSVELAAQR